MARNFRIYASWKVGVSALKKAIVTGATGFIGKFLVQKLVHEKVDVIAVVRKGSKKIGELTSFPIRIVECNIADFYLLPELIVDRDIDVLFHLAWQGVSDMDAKNEAIQIQNLISTLNLIDAAKQMSIPTFVGAGSVHEAEAILEMKENKVVSNLGYMYKTAKLAAHWMGKAKAGSMGIHFFWPMINTYGEEENSNRLINMLIRKMIRGEEPALSEGSQYYDFVHVADVACALFLIAENGKDGSNYFIGSGNAKPLKEFLEEAGKIVNKMTGKPPVSLGFGKIKSGVVKLPKEIFEVKNLMEDTGFRPTISFEEGIIRTVSYIQQQEENEKEM